MLTVTERERERLGMGEGTRICFTTKKFEFSGFSCHVVDLHIIIAVFQRITHKEVFIDCST